MTASRSTSLSTTAAGTKSCRRFGGCWRTVWFLRTWTRRCSVGTLYTDGCPDPDLIIRTGGEQRLSNFLIWQAAYSEYYHTPVLWPDLGAEDLDRALSAFGQRQRRFGSLDIQDHTAGA